MGHVYYPSLVVNLRLRFDEALHVIETPDPVAAQTLARMAPSETLPPQVRPLVLRPGSDNVSLVMGLVPKRASVDKLSYRQAGTFTLVFDFTKLPIDPRTIRSAAVEIHAGTIPAREYAEFMARGEQAKIATRIEGTGEGSPSGDRTNERNLSTLQMIGVVDEWDVEHSDSASEVHISGRDLRGILIDSPLPARVLETLDTSQRIDHVVASLLSTHPFGQEMAVVCNAFDWPGQQVPSPLAANLIPRHRRGARGQQRGGTLAVQGNRSDMTYWDAIVRLCYLVGAVPYYRADQLVIRPSRSLFAQQRQGVGPFMGETPFAGGRPRVVDGDSLVVRRMLWGDTMTALKMKRKLGGEARPKVVQCVGINTGPGQSASTPIVVARWPRPAAAPGRPGRTATTTHARGRDPRATSVAPGGRATQEEVITIPVPEVFNHARLEEIAHGLFEEIGRNEIAGEVETSELASYGGDNDDADLIRLQPGDAIEFAVDVRSNRTGAPLVSVWTEHHRTPMAQRIREVAAAIGDENLARVIVATSRGAIVELQRYFRVATAKLEWSTDRGMSVGFTYHNFFVYRFGGPEDLTAQPGTNTRTASASSTSSRAARIGPAIRAGIAALNREFDESEEGMLVRARALLARQGRGNGGSR